MSVLVKNMKMPKYCVNCRFHKSLYCTLTNIYTNTAQGCPLIEIPPHGRLIDADELMEHIGRDRLDSRERIAQMVITAPTIIEAEK